MTAYRNRFNAATQTNGTTVTAVNTGDSGDALASPTTTGTSTIKYDTTTPPSTGCAWVSLVPQAGATTGFLATIDFLLPTPSNDVTIEHTFDYPGAPTVANTVIFGFRTAANVRIGEFVMSTAGKPNFQPSGGSTMAAWTGTALTVGQKRIRVKLHTDSTTPANGTVSWYVYNDDTGALEASGSGTGTINGGTVGIIRHGCTSTSFSVTGNWTAWRYGMMQFANQLVDLGPFPTATANANAGPDWLLEACQSMQPGDHAKSRANLVGSGSTTTGTGTVSSLWSAAGGSGITFVDATALDTQAIIPIQLADRSDVLTLQVQIATADGTISNTDSTTITTKAAEHAVAVGGAWVPAGQLCD